MRVSRDMNFFGGRVFLGCLAALTFLFPLPLCAQDDLPPAMGDDFGLDLDLGLDDGVLGGADGAGEGDSSKEDREEAVRKEAFDAALDGLLPLRPEEIRALLERFDRTQESVELPVYPPPKPETVIQDIDLDPSAPPVALKLAYGHVSTISFVDMTGQPWPIRNLNWAGNFQIVESSFSEGEGSEGEYSHKIIMSPSSEFAYGNISISLLGLDTPIIMTLETGRDVVYYRFDAVIPEYGPMARAPLIQSSAGMGAGLGTVAGSVGMSSALEGIMPTGGAKLDVSGVDGRTTAFSYNGKTYVRTPLTLLSPGWSSSVSLQGGLRVYELGNAPVVLLSDRGRMVRARISNREDVFDE